jgi:hypothetical protein
MIRPRFAAAAALVLSLALNVSVAADAAGTSIHLGRIAPSAGTAAVQNPNSPFGEMNFLCGVLSPSTPASYTTTSSFEIDTANQEVLQCQYQSTERPATPQFSSGTGSCTTLNGVAYYFSSTETTSGLITLDCWSHAVTTQAPPANGGEAGSAIPNTTLTGGFDLTNSVYYPNDSMRVSSSCNLVSTTGTAQTSCTSSIQGTISGLFNTGDPAKFTAVNNNIARFFGATVGTQGGFATLAGSAVVQFQSGAPSRYINYTTLAWDDHPGTATSGRSILFMACPDASPFAGACGLAVDPNYAELFNCPVSGTSVSECVAVRQLS